MPTDCVAGCEKNPGHFGACMKRPDTAQADTTAIQARHDADIELCCDCIPGEQDCDEATLLKLVDSLRAQLSAALAAEKHQHSERWIEKRMRRVAEAALERVTVLCDRRKQKRWWISPDELRAALDQPDERPAKDCHNCPKDDDGRCMP